MHGHYFWDLFPAFLLSGIGLSLAFVPMTIGGLAGVDHSEAGIASGLINTSQQIGGAIGVAAATTDRGDLDEPLSRGPWNRNRRSGAHARLRDRLLRAARRSIVAVAAVATAFLLESKPDLAESAFGRVGHIVIEQVAA